MIPGLKIKTLRVSPAACSLIQQPAFVLYTQTHTIKHKHTLGACFLLPAVLFFFLAESQNSPLMNSSSSPRGRVSTNLLPQPERAENIQNRMKLNRKQNYKTSECACVWVCVW